MCGILGYFTNDEMSPEKSLIIQRAIEGLFMDSDSRGKDASGFAFLDHDLCLSVYKDAIPGSEMAFTDEFQSVFEDWKQTPQVMIGHTRKKTKGDEKNNVNNHPIYDKDTGIAITHNGSVDDSQEMTNRDGDVDSEIILRNIESEDKDDEDENEFIDQVVRGANKTIGRFAVAALHDRDLRLLLFRNDNKGSPKYGKTIHVMFLPEYEIIFYASEKKFLLDNVAVNSRMNGMFRFSSTKRLLYEFDNKKLIEFIIDKNNKINTRQREIEAETYFRKTTSTTTTRTTTTKNNNSSNNQDKERLIILPEDLPAIDKISKEKLSKFTWTPEDKFGEGYICGCESTVLTDRITGSKEMLCLLCGSLYDSPETLLSGEAVKKLKSTDEMKKLAYERLIAFASIDEAEEKLLVKE